MRVPSTVSATVARNSLGLATRVSTALRGIHTSANGANASFLGVIPPDGNTRQNHYYGYYRTNADARVLVEVGAGGTDDAFLRRTGLIGTTLTKAIVADLTARGLLK